MVISSLAAPPVLLQLSYVCLKVVVVVVLVVVVVVDVIVVVVVVVFLSGDILVGSTTGQRYCSYHLFVCLKVIVVVVVV